MEIIKIIGIGLLALVMIVIMKQHKPEFTVYISIIAGILILSLMLPKIEGIIQLLHNLSQKASINNQFLLLLLKMTAITFLIEFAVTVCKDAGESAIASKVELGGKVIMIAMSIPIVSSLLEMILKILP